MSYMRAQTNGGANYVNGGGSNRLGRFDFDTTPETSADERSRSRGPAGYGGFGQSAHVQGPARIERQRANRRSRDYEWSASRSRSRGATASRYGAAGGQVEDIIRYISQQWSFMASDSCIPVKVALQLMDSSSLGLQDQYDQFQQTHEQLKNALKVIVNEHHQGFNSSIGTFHKIQAAIHASQQRLRTLRAGLIQAKGSLGASKPELRAFATSSQKYDQMLQVVAQIEQLQAVPEQLEAQISEKRFLSAVTTLQEALALIRRPDLEDIGALADLRVYLSNQEHSLTDILIEELHSHLYLKSPYCEERWKSRSRRDAGASSVVLDEEKAMHTFLDQYDGSKPMQEDVTRNPEVNTFEYIQLLTESLNNLGKLDAAVDAIDNRMPVELFKVVERSHSEVEQRHPSTMRAVAARNRHHALGGIMGEGPDSERRATLEDLLTTLYAKFAAIAEGHRVLHDVTGAVLKRDGLPSEEVTRLNRSFRELWQVLQSEIRSLLHDHLASSGELGGQRMKDSHANTNIFKIQPRDRSRRLFKMSEMDPKSTDIATEKEDLEFILKSSVPGLVNKDAGHTKRDHEDDTIAADRSATGHKLLVEPSVFNMGILLPPSLAFLNRLKEILPPRSPGIVASSLTSFLDDFLLNVFHPQLEETLIELCGRSINNPDAFQADPDWQQYSQRPVFKGTLRFFEALEVVCGMLDSLPHEQSFSELVIGQMRAYYNKCFGWSRSLLQRAMASQDGSVGMKMRLAADLAHGTDVNSCVLELLKAAKEDNEKEAAVLAEKESALLIQMVKTRRIEEPDLVNDRKTIAALCTLHVSIKWLAAKCRALRFISPRAIDIADGDNEPSNYHGSRRRWTTTVHQLNNAPTSPYLPLDPQTAQQFDAVVDSFREVELLLLRTLHIDLRLHLLHGIYASMDKSYQLGQPYNDPDSTILALAESLASYDTAISTHLLIPQYRFLTSNLHVLANNALCSFVAAIRGMDVNGLNRMQLNVLVLQQSLKTTEPTATLSRAGRFWEIGTQGCAATVKDGVQEEYEKSDLKALVRLCWTPERDARDGTVEEWVSRLD